MVESRAPTVTVVAKFTSSSNIVKVPEELALLVTAMLVTIAVVAAGTVYNTVLVVVVAAPRNKVLGVAVILKLSFF
jgi:hypothetical protein